MSYKKIFMFSGQGSQYIGMGQKLFEQTPLFREHMLRLDRKIQKLIGESVLKIIYSSKKTTNQFDRLLYTNPAIFMVEYALAQTLIAKGVEPDGVIGSSMGEFASAVLADVLTIDEALLTLVEMSRLTELECERGGMLAVFHDPNLFHDKAELYKTCELASINFNSHFVVSSTLENLNSVKVYLQSLNIMYQQVPVHYPFHSSYLNPMADKYLAYLKSLTFNRPSIPYYSCVTGEQIQELSPMYFWDVVRQPIHFRKAINNLNQHEPKIYIDLGPSGTLASFVKQIISSQSDSKVYAIMTPFNQDIKHLNELVDSSEKGENERMLAYLFPGQGAQKKGMGLDLFDQFPELTRKADEILNYSIRQLCVEDSQRKLGQTQFTQPALYVVHALAYLKKLQETGRKPDFVAGHSLGEYNALFAAGAFDFETGLRLVKKRGELMSQVTGSGMAAVVGFSEEKIKKVLLENDVHTIDIANYNTPSQIVIAGPREDIERAQSIFESAGVDMYIVLRVSGAFHSRYMEKAKDEFSQFIKQFTFNRLQIPVISNVTARPYPNDTNPKQLLTEQITTSVQWTDTVRYLLAQGKIDLVEIGDSSVITKMVTKIKEEAEPLNLMKVASNKEEAVEHHHTQVKKLNVDTYFQDAPAISPESLGDEVFKQEYNVKYAYVAGSMYKGIASKDLVVKMSKAGMLSFYGTGGLKLDRLESDIQSIQQQLSNGEPYGMNLVHDPTDVMIEEKTVDLFLRYGIRHLEASAFMGITPALVKYRAKGLSRKLDGSVAVNHTIMAKVSRPDVAEAFLSPAPDRMIDNLVQEGKLTYQEADLVREVPMADDLCAEADSGGHTDHGVAFALLPAIIKLRDDMMSHYGYKKRVRVGAAGGIGTPEAAASMFLMGADFILTGSINQCTVEAGTSDIVKDLLNQMNVQDTESVPAGDMFEIGAKVQVLKKGVFFPARAKKLYELYRQYPSLDAIDEKTKEQLQKRYFKRSFEEIYEEVKSYHPTEEIEKAEKNPKHKMALVFRWYFGHSTRLAITGDGNYKVDYQIHTGPALGAFNQWVKGTELDNWRNRHVDEIGIKLMEGTVDVLSKRLRELQDLEKITV